MTGTDPGRKGHCFWLVTGRVDASDFLLLFWFSLNIFFSFGSRTWLHHVAYLILVPRPGEPTHFVLEMKSLNH